MIKFLSFARIAAVRLLLLLCFLSVSFACSRAELESPEVVQDSTRLSVSSGDTPDFSDAPVLTKGQVYTEDGSFVFNDGEQIALWYNEGSSGGYRNFVVSAGTVDTGTQSGTRDRWALYPLSAVPASTPYNGDAPYVVYASSYTVTGKETDSQMPLVAKNTAGNNKLVFYHVGGLLRLKLYGVPDNVASVKVGFSVNDITGTFPVNVSNPAAPVTGTTGTGTGSEVTFTIDRPTTSGGTVIYDPIQYVNVPLPAGTYPEQTLSVTLYDSSGNVVKKEGAPDSFTTTLNLGTVARRDGRILGISIYGITGAVLGVTITGEPGFLNSGSGGQIGGLYLNDSPFESQLYATVSYTSRSVQDNSLVEWESEDPTKVLVVQGKVMAVDVTTEPVKIWARSTDDPSKAAFVYITVTKESPTGNFVQRAFSIGTDKTVLFSPGNLVAKISQAGSSAGAKWRFATRQYDIVGPTNGSTMYLSPGDSLDVFYYSCEDMHFGIFNGPAANATTAQLNSFIDWGSNTIAYRSNPAYAAPYDYRTLLYHEFKFILNERTGAKAGQVGDRKDCRYAGVNIEGVYGLIIFPDGFQWVRSTMGDYPKRINTYSAPETSSYSGAQWAALEAAGVVFLPAAGRRDGTTLTYTGTSGSYLTKAQSTFPVYLFNSNRILDEGERNSKYTFVFSSFDFDFSDIYTSTTIGSVRLVKDEYVSGKQVVAVSINGDQPYQMYIGTPGTLQALVTYSDGSSELMDIVETMPADKVPNRRFNQGILSISGRDVYAQGIGYCLVQAERDGILSKPVVVGVADPVPGGGNYFHLDDGTRVRFAPGNLRAHIPQAGVPTADYWYFAPTQYNYLPPVNISAQAVLPSCEVSADDGDAPPFLSDHVHDVKYAYFPAGETEHFAYSDDISQYGLKMESRYLGITTGTGFEDWGQLLIRMPGSTSTYSSGYWKTPSFVEWSALLNRSRQVRISGQQILRPLPAEIFTINNKVCTVLVPDGLLVELPSELGDAITLARWTELEAMGCVALPHSGITIHDVSDGSNQGGGASGFGYPHGVGVEGYYWASDYEFEIPWEVGGSHLGVWDYSVYYPSSPAPPTYAFYAYVTWLRPNVSYSLDYTYGDWTIYSYFENADPSAISNTMDNVANMATRRNSTCAVRLIHLENSRAPIVQN